MKFYCQIESKRKPATLNAALYYIFMVMKEARYGLMVIAFLVSLILSGCVANKQKPVILNVTTKVIEVNGKKVTVNTITQPDGTWGYYGTQGQNFDVIVYNHLNEPTVIHWHGMLLPNNQDGTEITQTLFWPGESHDYHYPLKQAGTYWMHSHYSFQEQTYVEAPLIIYPPDYNPEYDIVIMFQDFSFTAPEKIFEDLKKGSMGNMEMSNKEMADMKPDLNDVDYDAFLTNYHTLENPVTKEVIPGQTYRLRFINGASATNFWIDLGSLNGTAIAMDANDIQPIEGSLFQLPIAERLDVNITIPAAGGVFPIIGKVEGENDQTGMILYTKGKDIPIIPIKANTAAPALNYDQEYNFHAVSQEFKNLQIKKIIDVVLTGNMQNYVWMINGQVWPNIVPIELKKDQNFQIDFINKSEMAHPMHIHGHFFQVIAIDGEPIPDGVIHDTVFVKPHSTVSVVLKADVSGRWFLHCHMLYHMHAGMMTFIQTR